MSWNTSTIGSLVGKDGLFCDGDWVESQDQDPNGDVRLIQLADIGDGYYVDKSNRFLTSEKAKELRCTYLNSGDVLVARMPDPLGRACIFPGDKKRAVTVVDVCVIRANDDKFHHRWLMHFLNAPQMRSKVSALQSGSTRKRISRGNLATIDLPIPPPKVQEKISLKVDELFSDLDAGVAALKRAQANLKRYRAAVLKAAVEGRLTAQWRAERKAKGITTEPAAKLLTRILVERRKKWEAAQLKKYADAGKAPPKGWQSKYPEPAAPKSTDLNELPEGWCWVTVEQVNIAERPISYGVLQPGSDVSDGVPLIRICDVSESRVHVDQLKCIDPKISAQFQRTIVQGGEVLLTIVGTIGRTAVVPDVLKGANTARAVAVIPVVSEISPYYVELCLREDGMRNRLTSASHEVARKTLNLEDVRPAWIPFAPFDEQTEIVAQVEAKLSNIAQAESEIKRSLERAARLRQAILKRAFEGRLV